MVKREMQVPVNVEVAEIRDLARLVASTVSMGQPIYVVNFEHNKKFYFGVLGVYNHYYEKQGMPLFYYFSTDQPRMDKYILVKMDEREEFAFGDGIRPGWIAVPIIHLKKKPSFIEF